MLSAFKKYPLLHFVQESEPEQVSHPKVQDEQVLCVFKKYELRHFEQNEEDWH